MPVCGCVHIELDHIHFPERVRVQKGNERVFGLETGAAAMRYQKRTAGQDGLRR